MRGRLRAPCARRSGSTAPPAPDELARRLGDDAVEREVTYRHPLTEPMDARGQGEVHAGFAFVAHRAVVDVDVELGIARVAQLACAQDVGRAINPLALEGQLEGGERAGPRPRR